MSEIILADSQAVFREGTAKVLGALSMYEDFRIVAQCSDVERMMHAITKFPGAILLFGSSLHPDMVRLWIVLEEAGSRAIVIAEDNESAGPFLRDCCRGMVFRSVTTTALLECVRRVAHGDTWVPPELVVGVMPEDDMVGTRVLHRLAPKEMCIVALIAQGMKNREIAIRLQTTEQVIKNYLRSIFDKTGVSDRLELALFTIYHRVLAQMAERMGNQLEAEQWQAARIRKTALAKPDLRPSEQ